MGTFYGVALIPWASSITLIRVSDCRKHAITIQKCKLTEKSFIKLALVVATIWKEVIWLDIKRLFVQSKIESLQ
jgi:hypothetical protein